MSFSYAIYVDTSLSEAELLKYVTLASQMSRMQEQPCFLLTSDKPDNLIVRQMSELFNIKPTVTLYFQIVHTQFFTAECEAIWCDILRCLLIELASDIVIVFNGDKVCLVKSQERLKVESDFGLWGIETPPGIIVSYELLPVL